MTGKTPEANGSRNSGIGPLRSRKIPRGSVLVFLVLVLAAVGGCDDEDCINCIDLAPPVVPTGVHSISGDNQVIVQWYDISYSPYDGRYNENVVSYNVYSRFFEEGEQYDPDRVFYLIGEVAWDENFDPETGLHWFSDDLAENGYQYEYAVAAVNAAGQESALSYEFVVDAPLPMSPPNTYVVLFDSYLGSDRELGGFDFSRAGENPGAINAGRVDPNAVDTGADIRIRFQGAVPFVEATSPNVLIQDAGNPQGPAGLFWFERVSWAPADGYSSTGSLELVRDHIYVAEIYDPQEQTLHYAKFGVVGVAPTESVRIVWAYQLIPGLPELKAPGQPLSQASKPDIIRL